MRESGTEPEDLHILGSILELSSMGLQNDAYSVAMEQLQDQRALRALDQNNVCRISQRGLVSGADRGVRFATVARSLMSFASLSNFSHQSPN